MSENLTNIVESILFGAGRPMRLSEIKTLLSTQNIEAELPNIKIAMNALEDRYATSALEIKEVASGYRLQIRNEYGDFLYPLWVLVLCNSLYQMLGCKRILFYGKASIINDLLHSSFKKITMKGTVKIRLSKRSKNPPCPGMIFPESLIDMVRLK